VYERNYAPYIFPATSNQVVMSMEYFETAGLVQSEPNFTVHLQTISIFRTSLYRNTNAVLILIWVGHCPDHRSRRPYY